MNLLRKLGLAAILFFCFVSLGCAPEVGSEEWCESMQEKPSEDWTTNDIANYGKHCIFN